MNRCISERTNSHLIAGVQPCKAETSRVVRVNVCNRRSTKRHRYERIPNRGALLIFHHTALGRTLRLHYRASRKQTNPEHRAHPPFHRQLLTIKSRHCENGGFLFPIPYSLFPALRPEPKPRPYRSSCTGSAYRPGLRSHRSAGSLPLPACLRAFGRSTESSSPQPTPA